MFIQADATRLPFDDKTFDLVFTSPPYTDARTYGIGAQRKCQEWVEWMLTVVAECVRVTRGLVLINCAGVTRSWCYQPGPEGLLYEWWKRGGRCWRPSYWHRVGIPGSGGKQWLRADVEYVLAFTGCQAAVPWADNTANGHAPKWAPGGEMSYRTADGERVGGKDAMGFHDYGGRGKGKNGKKKIARRISQGHGPDGDTRQDDVYEPPTLANPGCLVKGIKVGGGLMGHHLAHENEAPFPLKLAQWFIRGWCPPKCCRACGSSIEWYHEEPTGLSLPSMQQEIHGHTSQGPGVLLEKMCQSSNEEKPPAMRDMRQADRVHERESHEQVLLPEVRSEMGCDQSEKLQGIHGNDEGLHIETSAWTSGRESGRVRDGAQTSNGEGDRPLPGKRRSGSSQKRKKGRQQAEQSGADDEIPARLPAEAKKSNHLPEMRPLHSANSVCPSCGADLTRPDAIRPGMILDPFSGSGTTVHAAMTLGRTGVGCDIRESQVQLGRRRCADVQTELFA